MKLVSLVRLTRSTNEAKCHLIVPLSRSVMDESRISAQEIPGQDHESAIVVERPITNTIKDTPFPNRPKEINAGRRAISRITVVRLRPTA